MSSRFSATLLKRLFLDLWMIKFGCVIKMCRALTSALWGSLPDCSQFSLEVIGGHVGDIVDLELLVDGVALGLDKVGGVGVLELALGGAAGIGSESNVDDLALGATVGLVLEVQDSERRSIKDEVGSKRSEIGVSLSELIASNFGTLFIHSHDHKSSLAGSDLGEVGGDIFVDCDGHNKYNYKIQSGFLTLLIN